MSDFSDGHDLGMLAGKRQERERIIALIQDNACKCNASGCMKFDLGDVEYIIALIRGE